MRIITVIAAAHHVKALQVAGREGGGGQTQEYVMEGDGGRDWEGDEEEEGRGRGVEGALGGGVLRTLRTQ